MKKYATANKQVHLKQWAAHSCGCVSNRLTQFATIERKQHMLTEAGKTLLASKTAAVWLCKWRDNSRSLYFLSATGAAKRVWETNGAAYVKHPITIHRHA
ncbi:hypothetical protein TRVL_08596 [Trypanosoma vivax]|nr:hypothetical protein TRVL_08596 [Trypanosoma vivax]